MIQVWGTLAIILSLALSFCYYYNKERKICASEKQSRKNFAETLLEQAQNQKTYLVICAEGDNNSEVNIKKVVKNITMPEGKRINE